MKPSNAGKDMYLRVQTTNQKLKQHARTQYANGMQAVSFCYITDRARGYILTF